MPLPDNNDLMKSGKVLKHGACFGHWNISPENIVTIAGASVCQLIYHNRMCHPKITKRDKIQENYSQGTFT